ncbi:hypothetical protein [Geobacter grbiciae]|uniref:hypothetical protein n=1 Tax=Geobacter grbiciae TaxID=155042 RepID=UPI001C00A4DC|nr:hypothetical protein [Geobacter grbiciae]MBT1075623.1 hypothetical protein [Geobacter grbiciae]
MGEITRQTRAELRQLPQMLGKLAGGIAAVIGFTAAVVIITRKPGALLGDILLSLLVGMVGVVIFVVSARSLARHLSAHNTEEPLSAAGNVRSSLLSWGLLLLFAVIFLAGVWFVTK